MPYKSPCKCPITPNMSFDELQQIIIDRTMCTERAMYICPNLDRELRRADAERVRRAYYDKRLRKEGFSQEEINSMPRRKRATGRSFEEAEVDFDF